MGADVNNLVDELRDAAIALDAAVWQSGLQGRFTSTRRSHSEQVRLYRAYVSGRHPFPVAPPGASAHEYGEAFDYLVSPSDAQADVGYTWQQWGGVWGGRTDVVHFELPGASQRALKAYQEGKLPEQESTWFDYATGLLPLKAVDVMDTPLSKQIIDRGIYSPTLCKVFGIFC